MALFAIRMDGLPSSQGGSWLSTNIYVPRRPKYLHFFLDAKVAAAPLTNDIVRFPVHSVMTYIFQTLGLDDVNFQTFKTRRS